jgi:hypothetical protein
MIVSAATVVAHPLTIQPPRGTRPEVPHGMSCIGWNEYFNTWLWSYHFPGDVELHVSL